MIVIIDYGMGNLRSILNKLERLDTKVIISSRIEDIENAEKIILPGVGSFAAGMENLEKYNIITILNKKVIKEQTPILGICLGMQLFTKGSEEGNADGLGWIDAETIRFDFDKKCIKLKIPHMGLNSTNLNKDNYIFKGIDNNSKFYFVHSYHVLCNDTNNIITTTNYGYDFASAIQKDTILGVQFHPEKSHENGLRLLKNFVNQG